MYSYIFHKVLGWNIIGQFDPSIKKSIVAVAPHTSWHDFAIGALTRSIIKVDINFVGKKELFTWPIGAYFRWMGGAPIDRSKVKNTVTQITDIFNSKTEFRLAIAPEGTRKAVDKWKTGFYYMALYAKVPIIRVSFDYKLKQVKIGDAFYVTGDIESDMPIIRSFYEGVQGKKY